MFIPAAGDFLLSLTKVPFLPFAGAGSKDKGFLVTLGTFVP
jgi:hypothetical protein